MKAGVVAARCGRVGCLLWLIACSSEQHSRVTQDAQALDGRDAAPSDAALKDAEPNDAAPQTPDAAVDEPFAFGVSAQLASELDDKGCSTVGILTWNEQPADADAVWVEFGPDSTYGKTTPPRAASAERRVVLLGMGPERDYHYRLVAARGSKRFVSEDAVLRTGPLPAGLDIGYYTVPKPALHSEGYLLASYWNGPGSNFVFIVDHQGQVVWSYDVGVENQGIARLALSADGKSFWAIGVSNRGKPLIRIDVDTLSSSVFDQSLGSHDITPIAEDRMAFIEYGESDCDSLYEIDSQGVTRELWDSESVLAGVKPECHGNAVHYWPEQELFTYSDLGNDVFALSGEGDILWRLSERVPGGAAAWGGRSHGHHLLSNSLLLFANLGGPNQTSAAIEYDFDGNEVWRYEGGITSANLGDVQRLPNGNTLITYSNAQVLQEVTPDGEVATNWSATQMIGYTRLLPSLYVAR